MTSQGLTPPPLSKARRGFAIVCFPLAIGLFIYCGLSGFAWNAWNDSGDRLARILALALACAAAAFFAVTWGHWHGQSVLDRRKASTDLYPEFEILSDRSILKELEKSAASLRASAREAVPDVRQPEGARRIADHVVTPQNFRLKVLERVTLKSQQRIHSVEIAWAPGAFVALPEVWLVPIMRLRKGDPMRELEVEGGSVLSSLETAAIVNEVVGNLAGSADRDGRNITQLDRQAIARAIVLKGDEAKSARDSILDRLPLTPPWRVAGPRRRIRLFRWRRRQKAYAANAAVLDLLIESRPFIAAYRRSEHSTPPGMTRFTYRSSHDETPKGMTYDWWRRLKDRLRRLTNLPPKLIALHLERAYSAQSYRLQVSCEENLYIDEANVWDQREGNWVAALKRSGTYRSYLGWEAPTGKAFTSLGAARLSLLRPRTSLFFTVRLVEKPPGALGPAVAVSFASALVIWLVGSVGQADGLSVDLVAFVLATPAIAATSFGVLAASAPFGLRSGTASVALSLDLLWLLLATSFFIRSRVESDPLTPPTLGPDRYFFFLHDYLWIALFSAAMLTFVVCAGTLIQRVVRYRTVVKDSRVLED